MLVLVVVVTLSSVSRACVPVRALMPPAPLPPPAPAAGSHRSRVAVTRGGEPPPPPPPPRPLPPLHRRLEAPQHQSGSDGSPGGPNAHSGGASCHVDDDEGGGRHLVVVGGGNGGGHAARQRHPPHACASPPPSVVSSSPSPPPVDTVKPVAPAHAFFPAAASASSLTTNQRPAYLSHDYDTPESRARALRLFLTWNAFGIAHLYVTRELLARYRISEVFLTVTQLLLVIVYGLAMMRVMPGVAALRNALTMRTLVRMIPLSVLVIVRDVAKFGGLARVSVNLAVTLRSMSPVATVLLQMLFWGDRFPADVVVSLLPIICGVSLASAADLSAASSHGGGGSGGASEWVPPSVAGLLIGCAACVMSVFFGVAHSMAIKALFGDRDRIDPVHLQVLQSALSLLLLLPYYGARWLLRSGSYGWSDIILSSPSLSPPGMAATLSQQQQGPGVDGAAAAAAATAASSASSMVLRALPFRMGNNDAAATTTSSSLSPSSAAAAHGLDGTWTREVLLFLAAKGLVNFAQSHYALLSLNELSNVSFSVASSMRRMLSGILTVFIFYRSSISVLGVLGISLSVLGCMLYDKVCSARESRASSAKGAHGAAELGVATQTLAAPAGNNHHQNHHHNNGGGGGRTPSKPAPFASQPALAGTFRRVRRNRSDFLIDPGSSGNLTETAAAAAAAGSAPAVAAGVNGGIGNGDDNTAAAAAAAAPVFHGNEAGANVRVSIDRWTRE